MGYNSLNTNLIITYIQAKYSTIYSFATLRNYILK